MKKGMLFFTMTIFLPLCLQRGGGVATAIFPPSGSRTRHSLTRRKLLFKVIWEPSYLAADGITNSLGVKLANAIL
jgi:hypothetical protein